MWSKHVKTITATMWRISTAGVQWDGGRRWEKAGWEILWDLHILLSVYWTCSYVFLPFSIPFHSWNWFGGHSVTGSPILSLSLAREKILKPEGRLWYIPFQMPCHSSLKATPATNLLLYLYDFDCSKYLAVDSYGICLLWLAFFTWCNVLKVHPCCLIKVCLQWSNF